MRTALVHRPTRTALVISEDAAVRLRCDRDEAERRQLATERVCHLVAMALEEGAESAVVRILEPTAGGRDARRVATRFFPGYTRIRNFLIGELDADEWLACRVAMSRVAMHNRHLSYLDRGESYYGSRAEVGWL